MKPGRVLVMAGGTGGHVYPALAVAQELAARGWQVDWVGTERGIEARLVPAAGFVLHTLAVMGLRGKGLIARLRGLLRLIAASVQAIVLVRRLQPHVVLGMGGYAAGPAGMASALWRRPLVIHEQNAVFGTTNRLLAPFATRVLAGLPGQRVETGRAELVGNPLRPTITALHFAERAAPDSRDGDRPLHLLILGGSLGAQPLNQHAPAAVAALLVERPETAIIIQHQCGEAHVAATEAAWQHAGVSSASVQPFIEDMAQAYAWADVVVCRAGALTISELAAAGVAAILVPLPHAIDDHQTRNAMSLVDSGAALLLPQSALLAGELTTQLRRCVEDTVALERMAQRARRLAQLRATERVADILEEVADER